MMRGAGKASRPCMLVLQGETGAGGEDGFLRRDVLCAQGGLRTGVTGTGCLCGVLLCDLFC